MLKHELSKLEAHEATCKALRGDIQCESYYDPVSDDDTIFDLIEEMDQEQYAEQYKETILDFDVTDFNNNEVVPGTSGILNEKESSAMVNVVDVQTVDNSYQGSGSVVFDFLFIVTPIVGVCNCSMFYCTLLYVHSSIAII